MFLLFATVLLLGGRPLESFPVRKLLMEPSELDQALSRVSTGELLVLDARPEAEFGKARVPGAQWVDAAKWAKQFNQQRDPAAWAKLLSPYRLRSTATPIVIYDDSMTKDAARIWWILRFWGFEEVRLLHGGWRGWQAAKLPTATGPSSSDPAPLPDFTLTLVPRSNRLKTKEQLLARLKREGDLAQIVDARSLAEHCGTTATAKRNGAIPGAKHLDWVELVDKETHRFRSPNELRKLFGKAGIDLERPLVTYCQSGGRASVMAFALELMGAKEVMNYHASWAEWGNDEQTPILKAPRADP